MPKTLLIVTQMCQEKLTSVGFWILKLEHILKLGTFPIMYWSSRLELTGVMRVIRVSVLKASQTHHY